MMVIGNLPDFFFDFFKVVILYSAHQKSEDSLSFPYLLHLHHHVLSN